MASDQDIEDPDKHVHEVHCPYATSIGHSEGSCEIVRLIHRYYSMTEVRKGDLFASEAQAIVNTVNCVLVM